MLLDPPPRIRAQQSWLVNRVFLKLVALLRRLETYEL